ncbi:MAG TPA: ABC transporter substrate-binding protein [Nitrososphaeraceae archaeon]
MVNLRFIHVSLSFIIIAMLVASLFFNNSIMGTNSNSTFNSTSTSQPVQRGAFVDTVRFIRYSDQNVALEQVKLGNIAVYYFGIPLEVVSEVRNNPAVQVYDRTAGSIGLLLNPAPVQDNSKSINPFQLREIRYAINFLVNREFVVDEILNGYGTILVDPFGYYSPEYLNVIDTVESFGIRYNPKLAERIISDALEDAGALKDKSTGKWTFSGVPITVKILIRSDDPRRKSLGDLIASDLDKVGFTILKQYGDLNKANTVVSGSNPQDFQWHIYTEGYAGTSAFAKYNPGIPSQMYAPYLGNMPGGQNPAFWNYHNSSLDNVTQKIQFFNFTSEIERNNLLRNATKAGIQESVRIFVAQNTDPYIADSDVKGLINDFGAGITSKLSLINAQPPNLQLLNIGVKEIYQGAWNNVAGCGDTYCTSIYSALGDGATFRNPYTGEVIPMRNVWTEILSKSPTERIKVSTDAQTWDPYSKKWKLAGNDTYSLSKVDYKLLFSKWHNGIAMDKSDILYSQYFPFEWGTDEGNGDLTIDPEYTSAVKVGLPLIKGIKFTKDNEIESYIDQWHYDKKEIAASSSVWASEPWEITAATERLVTSGKLAFSRGEATVKQVPWLSLIISSHAEMIKVELQRMKAESFVPLPLVGIVTKEQAIKRYDASINWINQHRHAVISNGPFYLDSYNPTAGIITIRAFRDLSYPFVQGYWSVFENPEIAVIEKVNVPKYVTPGQPLKIIMNVTVGGKPTDEALVNYFLSNMEGKVLLRGIAEPLVNKTSKYGLFEITLNSSNTAKLQRGPNLLKIFANTNQAFRPDIYTVPLLTLDSLAPENLSNVSGNAISVTAYTTHNAR